MTNIGDTIKVKIPIFSRDISDYFRQLDFAHGFDEYDISLQIVDQIYYLNVNMGDITQEIKSAYLYTDVCYLDEKTKLIILRILINLIKQFLFLIIMLKLILIK